VVVTGKMKFGGLFLLLRRMWRRVVQVRRTMTDRPMFRAGGVIVMLALFFSACLHWVEHVKVDHVAPEVQPSKASAEDVEDWPYATYPGTLQQVAILLFSGFDGETPQHTLGWALAMLCALLGIAFVALVTADLSSVLVGMAALGAKRRKVRMSGHVLICGWHDSIHVLIEQLTSRERDPRREIVVLDGTTTQLPVRDPDVHLIQGDPTHEEALTRAGALRAHSLIIPCDSRLPEHLQDSAVTLTAMATKAVNQDIYSCVEVLKHESRRHVERLNIDEVVCLGELSQALLAQAATSHGLSKLIEDLLTFNKGNEIRRIALPDELAGRTFRWLFRQLNEHLDALLLAVDRGNTSMHINPRGHFVLEKDDGLFIVSETQLGQLDGLTAYD